MAKTELAHIEAKSLEDIHAWLTANHTQSESVWLITYKQAHPAYLPWGAVVDELLCWGWVDSSVRKVDDDRMKHLISPRKETSAWSAVNKGIVDAMRKAGRMQPDGEAKIAAAQANGMWEFLDDVERLEVPDDLAAAMAIDRATWEGWSRSIKRAWLEKIKWAKTETTREKRVAECADAVRRNLKNGGLR